MVSEKKMIRAEARKRAHKLSPFVKAYYGDSIYETAQCKYCGHGIMIQDGEVCYDLVSEFQCKGMNEDV